MDSTNEEALDIIVTNVVATFRTRCHLNLRTIALEGINVIYKPEVGVRMSLCLDLDCIPVRTALPFFPFLESPDETSQAHHNSLNLVLRENHLHRSNKVDT